MAGLLIGIAALTAAAHWPALSAEALSFDDNQFLTENPLVQNPSWTSAGRFLGEVFEPSTVKGYYLPFSMISLMIDYALGGRADHLLPFHRTSLILHVLNTVLIVALLYSLFGQAIPAAAAGLLFGVHPLTVEPVVWIGERKTLLAAFFTLWCLLLYVQHTRRGGVRWLVPSIAAYLLAMMSKPTALPLPVLLLLTDVWPLRRVNVRVLIEKIPFLVLAGMFGLITLVSHARTGGLVTPGKTTLSQAPLLICYLMVFYLGKIVWPTNLTSVYAMPNPVALSNMLVLGSVIAAAALASALVVSLRRTRALLVGCAFFFVAIFPTLGVLRYSWITASDKYVYVPAVGLLMILAWALKRIWQTRDRLITPARIGFVLALVLAAAAETRGVRSYLAHWRDTASLFEYMVTQSPESARVHDNLGNVLLARGNVEAAIEHYRRAVELESEYPNPRPHYNLANALLSQNRIDEAIRQYRRALEIDPAYVVAYCNLGNLLLSQGRIDQAIEQYEQALRADTASRYVRPHYNLGLAMLSQRRVEEAIQHFRQAIQIRSDFVPARISLGMALQLQGKLDEAIDQYRETVRLAPNDAQACVRLGLALKDQGETTAALEHLQRAAHLKPDDPGCLGALAWILATHRDPTVRDARQAIELGRQAVRLTNHKNVEALDTLAAAYAAGGEFGQATTIAEQALSIASAANLPRAAAIRERLKLYREGKPYYEPPRASGNPPSAVGP